MECGDRGGAERERERWFEVIFFILSLSSCSPRLSLPPSLIYSLTHSRTSICFVWISANYEPYVGLYYMNELTDPHGNHVGFIDQNCLCPAALYSRLSLITV